MATLERLERTRIVESPDELVLSIVLPYANERELAIDVAEHELTVRARDFEETVELPETVDACELRIACTEDRLEVHVRKPHRVLLDPEAAAS